MHLKQYLRKHLAKQAVSLREAADRSEEALKVLEAEGTRDAFYSLRLHSLWEGEGGHSITLDHEGTLKQAVQLADRKFMDANSSDDVQAQYFVHIILGEARCSVPERYWRKFTQKGTS